MYSVNRRPLFFRRHNPIGSMNSSDYQHAIFRGFDFPANFRCQSSTPGINFARFQRAAKSAKQSTTGGGNHVVKRGCMSGIEFGRIDSVVRRDRAMDTERDRLRFAGKMGDPQRS